MNAFLSKNLRSDRRVWLWTSAVLFIILGFIHPGGKTGQDDLPPLFFVADILRPLEWFANSSVTDPFFYLELFLGVTFVGVYVVMVAFVSAVLGWLLQFLVAPLIPFRTQAGVGSGVVLQPPYRSGSAQIGMVRMVLAAYGGGAATFGAVVSGLNGVQFWCLWFVYDQAHRALTGFHSWSSLHSMLVFLVVCCLNAAGSAFLARKISSPVLRVRLGALAILGLQLATLILAADIFGLRTF